VLVELVSTIPGIAAGQLVSPGEGATGQVVVLCAPVIVNDYQRSIPGSGCPGRARGAAAA
jgi:hypothetical protein